MRREVLPFSIDHVESSRGVTSLGRTVQVMLK